MTATRNYGSDVRRWGSEFQRPPTRTPNRRGFATFHDTAGKTG